MTGPAPYDEIGQMPLTDVLNRYQALSDRDSMARSIAVLQARGTWNADGSIRAEDHPPLTAAEHLELIALGERLARYYRHPALVHHAVRAGRDLGADRRRYRRQRQPGAAGLREWAVGQHRLRQDFPGGTIGLSDDEYDAALEAADDITDGG